DEDYGHHERESECPSIAPKTEQDSLGNRQRAPHRCRSAHRAPSTAPSAPGTVPLFGGSFSSSARNASSRSAVPVDSRNECGVSKASTRPSRRNSTRSQLIASPR